MKQIKEWAAHFEVRRIFKALVYMLLLSFFYNLAYLYTLQTSLSYLSAYALQIALSLLSSLGLYFLCTMAWGKKKGTLSIQAILLILGLQAFYILLVQGIFSTLYLSFYENVWVQMILALFSAAGIFLMAPFQLVWYFGIYQGNCTFRTLWQYTLSVFRRHWRSLINWFAVLLLAAIILDTLFYGVFSLANGFYPVDVLSRLLFMANPMMGWMLLLYASIFSGISASALLMPVFLCFVSGFFQAVLALNYVLLIERKGEGNGSVQPETHP